MMHFRKNDAPRLSPAEARRQGQITHLAFLLLGREPAMAFLNDDNARLGGRPLDLAMASEEGCANIEAELGRLTCR
jgi:hypothetical protein